MSLVSLFHMLHPHSESAKEAASQQATGTDLLKVRARKYLPADSALGSIGDLHSIQIVPHFIKMMSRGCKEGARVASEVK